MNCCSVTAVILESTSISEVHSVSKTVLLEALTAVSFPRMEQ